MARGGAFAGAAFEVDAGGSFSTGPLASARASAGVSASEGAFALLGTRTPRPRRPLDTSALVVRTESTRFSITEKTQYAVGGRVLGDGSASFRADVGQGTSFTSRIEFEED
jgi:hypothetical protein